ncbi:MAG: hypothetical protein HYT43_00485 [Candidatus Taylorbacteria bacterium]|nr:hypothetical protein [Candidatus Taylorbacteria bacterium]
MNIRQIWEKCKDKGIFTVLIIILVALGSFGLGRLSMIEFRDSPLSITANSEALSAKSLTEDLTRRIETQSGAVLGSKNSKKYHFPWCGGAARLNEKNKVWFSSIEEAKAAGYSPAANCKGLK